MLLQPRDHSNVPARHGAVQPGHTLCAQVVPAMLAKLYALCRSILDENDEPLEVRDTVGWSLQMGQVRIGSSGAGSNT